MCLIRRKEGEYVRRITEAGRCGVERRLLAVSIEMPVTAAVLGAAVFYVIGTAGRTQPSREGRK